MKGVVVRFTPSMKGVVVRFTIHEGCSGEVYHP